MNRRIWVVCPFLALMAAGCIRGREENREREAESLFNDVRELVISYTDSMAAAKDSVSVAELSERFEERITKINMGYPPETDFSMTEQENDTLKVLLEKYAAARDSRLEKLHLAPGAVETQTEADSAVVQK